MMASNSSDRSESPADIDFSVIRTAIQMDHKMIDQILHGIHYGSDEVRSLLREECDFIMECKVCRNLFRSFPNFVAHKRVYCLNTYEEKALNDSFVSPTGNSDTVILQPDAPEPKAAKPSAKSGKNLVEEVVNRTFDGKSKDYQFYTKVAENVEKQKVTKVTNTVTLTSIASNPNAMVVSHTTGDNSEEIMKVYEDKQAELNKKTKQSSPKKPIKPLTLTDVCEGLVKKKQSQQVVEASSGKVKPVTKKVVTRSRKSSPRKSVDYVADTEVDNQTRPNKGGKLVDNCTDVDLSEWQDTSLSKAIDKISDSVGDKDWMKYCNIKALVCNICEKHCSSLYNLKVHVKMKHVNCSSQYQCTDCPNSFEYFTVLARHMRSVHNLSDNAISSIQVKLQNPAKTEKTEEKMETEEDMKKEVTDESPAKPSNKLLSYSTGWKKCDKCGKVFWKAKSYYRHHSSCKGTSSKSPQSNTNSKSPQPNTNSKSPLPSPKKTSAEKQNSTPRSIETIVVGPKGKIIMRSHNKELLKLQEKLRAKALTTVASDKVNVVTNTENVKVASQKDGACVLKNSEETTPKTDSQLYQALTKILNNPPLPVKDMQVSTTSSEGKLSNLRHTDNDTINENFTDGKVTRGKIMISTEMESDDNKNLDEFKKLQERLTREAGLKDDADMNHAQEEPKTATSIATNKGKNTSANVELLIDLKSPQKKSGTPEIQELQVKLARKALGQTDSGPKTRNVTDNVSQVERKSERRSKSAEKSDIVSQVESMRSIRHISKEQDDKSNIETHVSEDSSADVRFQSSCDSGKGIVTKRHFRSVSQGNERVGEKTPEKLSLSTSGSPILSRRQSFPSSPTPSLQSNSADGYSHKFKMTVQEMAELVESAGLTKFAKERKKKARTFLTKKQAKDSQKVAVILSKPMKRRTRQKRNVIVRNVYGTRHSGVDETLHTSETENLHSSVKAKRLSLEQKRLQNSAGFVEEKFYASGATAKEKGKNTEKYVEPTKLVKELKRLENSAGLVEKNLYSSLLHDSTKHEDEEFGTEHSKKTVETNVKQTDCDSSNEGRQSREMKKLANSACFVEDKYYTGSSRDSSKDRLSDTGLSNMPRDVKQLQKSGRNLDKIVTKHTATVGICRDRTSNFGTGRSSRDRKRHVSLPGSLGKRSHSITKSVSPGNRTQANIKAKKASVVPSCTSSSDHKNVSCASTGTSLDKNVSSTEDTSKHRTRLSTGSIFFDSELLKLSPSKIEKKIAAEIAKKGKESDVQKSEKSAACVRLNLSPHKAHSKVKQPKRSGSYGFYPLSTGIIQCPKCQKKFWKKKSFDFHINHACTEREKTKVGKKRTLSLSPKDPVGSKITSKKVEAANKKPKLDIVRQEKVSDSTAKAIEEKQDVSSTIDEREENGHAIRLNVKSVEKLNTEENIETNCNREEADKIALDSGGIQKTEVSPIFPRTSRNKSKQYTQSSQKESLEKKTTFVDIQMAKSSKTANTSSALPLVSQSPVKADVVKGEEDSNDTEEKQNKSSTGLPNIQSVPKSSDGLPNIQSVPKSSADLPNIQSASKDPTIMPSTSDQSVCEGESAVFEVEQVRAVEVKAGPSGEGTSRSDALNDSDDNSSEFSGFSEDDLKSTEVELSSRLDMSEKYGVDEQHTVDLESDDLSDLGNLDLSSEDDMDSDVEMGSVDIEKRFIDDATNMDNVRHTSRPIRKSARNRFGHIDDVWVCEEGGERNVDRGKGQPTNTREYVLDVDNSHKLMCHNSRDVDRLIDEKNLKCKQCDTPCVNISNLRRHVIFHLGWKRYKCKLCSYTCYDKSRCSRHCQTAHDEQLTSENFTRLVLDLKKEATKLRAQKRTNTLRSTKIKAKLSDEDIYQKPKSSTVPRINTSKCETAIYEPISATEKDMLTKARIGLSKALKHT